MLSIIRKASTRAKPRAPENSDARVAISESGITAHASSSFAALDNGIPSHDLELFAGLSRDVMISADTDGTLERVNDSFTQLFGYSMADLAGTNIASIFHADDRAEIQAALESLNQKNAHPPVVDCEARVLTRTGSERWMEWRLTQNNGRLYCLGHDVSAIKRQEKALQRRAGQLKEAESIGGMGHWRWQIGEEAIDWSDELYRIFGVTRENFKPTLQSMNAMINRRDINKVNQAFQRAMMEQNDYDMEFRVKRPDGEERFIRCEGRCAVDTNGEAVALYGIMQDMTERLRHEQALKEAKDAAERAYAAKSQFLANMSHELRTPLNAIIGFSEIMQRQLLGPIGTEKYLEYTKGILESGEHLLDIIGDILDMSKIEAGKYELALEEVNVLKTIRLAVHMMESRAVDSNVKIAIAKPAAEKNDDNLTIVADRRAFLQILLNILSNAVKFSRENGRIEVELLTSPSPLGGEGRGEVPSSIAIKITDHGIGIPANKLASITRPFEQVQSHYTREHEGTGLGLAITKELAETHGGSLHIESQINVGTTVTVKLPLDASNAKAGNQAAQK